MVQDVYYGRPEISNSDLSAVRKLGMATRDRVDFELAYKFGRLIDCMITEPQAVNRFLFQCSGEQYDAQDFALAEEMRRSFLKVAICRQILAASVCQKVMVVPGMPFQHKGASWAMDVRCKWDLWQPAVHWGGDIKSTTATTMAQFIQAARHFDYDRQRAWYMDIAGSHQDLLIGISKKKPYPVFLHAIRRGDPFYLSGREKYLDLSLELHQLQAA